MTALALIIGLALAPQFDMIQRLQEFDHHYYLLKAALLGCPKGATLVEECDPKTGTLDYKEFLATGREASKIWGIECQNK